MWQGKSNAKICDLRRRRLKFVIFCFQILAELRTPENGNNDYNPLPSSHPRKKTIIEIENNV